MTTTASGRPTRYGRAAIGIHWISAILIMGLLIEGTVMTKIADDDFKTSIYQFHVSFGYVVLILTIIRLVWAIRDRRDGLSGLLPGRHGPGSQKEWDLAIYPIPSAHVRAQIGRSVPVGRESWALSPLLGRS